ncbi:uncharacterized protein BP01DRAFT_389433 [Aspergillus saccharolyticus JOP 1030-1]|uniref:Uncharacterized protein n=1 Tax=Aspergillus saccharolyticus JOP 1030-1 TaxID=1450539 RepID=A0A318ZNP5_9EURO|nr:hypothetical protein BP01DRAFT_389433 [Aspergillus saccharolyticus JOP 1030-1]PYH48144.1 hypothetical protein BP01DRAFT_389433 [Aspergillus saccharolyticus JOP 1030-1]
MNSIPPSNQATVVSRLESLPVEIIQTIFLHSLEINLPRASPRLGEALSSATIYIWLIRLAFSSTNAGVDRDFFTKEFLPYPLDLKLGLSPVQRRDLQTTLLACRWCTLPLMRRCQREYLLHTLRQKCRPGVDFVYYRPEDEATLHSLLNEEDSSSSSLLSSITTGQTIATNPGKGDLILLAHPATSTTTKTHPHKLALYPQNGALQIRSPNDIYTSTHPFSPTSSAHPTTYRLPSCVTPSGTGPLHARIPDKLLHPPFTPSKLEFLQLLCSADAYIDETPAHDRSRRALRQTIRDREFGAFCTLLQMQVRVPWYGFPVPWPVSGNHLCAAVKYADPTGVGEDGFVRVLVRERWGDLWGEEEKGKARELLLQMGFVGEEEG